MSLEWAIFVWIALTIELVAFVVFERLPFSRLPCGSAAVVCKLRSAFLWLLTCAAQLTALKPIKLHTLEPLSQVQLQLTQ